VIFVKVKQKRKSRCSFRQGFTKRRYHTYYSYSSHPLVFSSEVRFVVSCRRLVSFSSSFQTVVRSAVVRSPAGKKVSHPLSVFFHAASGALAFRLASKSNRGLSFEFCVPLPLPLPLSCTQRMGDQNPPPNMSCFPNKTPPRDSRENCDPVGASPKEKEPACVCFAFFPDPSVPNGDDGERLGLERLFRL